MKKISALAIAGVFTASLAATAFAEMAEVKVGGEIRVRDEVRNNYTDFNKDAGDQTSIISQRTRVNVDAKVNETTKAYISLQDTRNWGSETQKTGDAPNGTTSTANTGNDTSAVDVSEAYLQLDKLFGQPLSLKIGRQALAYGDQRLIGSFEWSDNARRFDAIKLMYNTDAFSVDLFTATVREQDKNVTTSTDVLANHDNSDGQLNGIYATVKSIPLNTLDLYLLQKKRTVPGEDFLTYGLRINGGVINIDWTAEAAWQSGDASTDVDKDANMYALRAGYTIPAAASLRIGGEYVNASGQDDSGDNTAFDNLYPTNHPLYGVSDVLEYYGDGNALSDLKSWSLNVSAKPVEGLKLLAEYWNHEAEESGDKIGTEMNLQAWYAINPNVDLHAYYAQFNIDSDLADVSFGGNDDPATDMVIQVAVKF